MGYSEKYCALCGGPLKARSAVIGRPSTRATAPDEGKETLASQDEKDQEYLGWKTEDDRPDENQKQDEAEDHSSYEYSRTYNSTVLRGEMVKWLDDICLFGRNPGTQRCFITGPAKEINDANIYAADIGDDPNVPEDGGTERIFLETYSEAIPVHYQCLHCILPKVLDFEIGNGKGLVNSTVVDIGLAKLYSAAEQSGFEIWDKVLGLDYYEGDLATTEQEWVSVRGDEALVADPIKVPELKVYCEQLPCHAPPSISDRTIYSTNNNQSGIFETLPLEVLAGTVKMLPSASLKALQVATPAAAWALASGFFWKQRIKVDLPWLWDLPLDQALPTTEIYWQQVYWDMDHRSTFGSSDAFLGLVNRRRIWKICHQLAVTYAAEVDQ